MKTMTVNEIVKKVVKYFSTFTQATEITTGEAIEKVLGFTQDQNGEYLIHGSIIDFHDMFQIDYNVRKEAVKAGIGIDDRKYEDMVTGLPFHIPYIVKSQGYFAEYINEENPEHWHGFPELMWYLGFEMDCYSSMPKTTELDCQTHSEKERQDHLLKQMPQWTAQEVGNYIFSRYRELTHWSDYGYPEEKGGYFFKHAFPILQQKIGEEWESRNEAGEE